MGKIWKTLCLILLVVLAVGFRQQRKQETQTMTREWIRQAEEVEAAVAALGMDALERQKNLAKWYNYNLELGTAGLGEAYRDILNFGGGHMAVLTVPQWELRMPIGHGGGGAVSHDPATALPIGGRGNHTVLYLTEAFPWSEEMCLYIDCLGQRLTYRVISVQEENGEFTPEDPEKADLLTLVFQREGACVLVRCERSTELVIRQEESGAYFPRTAPAAALPVLMLVWIWRGKSRQKAVERGRN